VDFSAILILPFSAIVAFAILLGAAMLDRPAPRLIWPCVFSTVVAALLFLRFPDVSALGIWLFALFGLAFSAAIGTVIGGLTARTIVRVIAAPRR